MRSFRSKVEIEQLPRRGPTRCPSCHAWLPSTATSCDYCLSVRPVRRKPEGTRAPTASVAADEAAFGSKVDSFLRGIPGG